jgi:hypothetical protein
MWMADTDLGEMFLNFILHESLPELAGVDVTHYLGDEPDKKYGLVWERWLRCTIGLKPSPYQTTQAMLFAEDVIRGDSNDDECVFHWDQVKMNLPGDPHYDPSLPLVFKVKKDGTPAADFFFHVDDNRTTGNSEQEAWQAARRVSSVCSYLGIQDASRKRRSKVSRMPGAWTGDMVSTDDTGVYVTVSQEKWVKAKDMVAKTVAEVNANDGWLVRKDLEHRRGFLLYVTRTFPATVPYLKGFHLTIDGWRNNRNDEGRKYLAREVRELLEKGEEMDTPDDVAAHPKVKAKARLVECDLPAMPRLFDLPSPPQRLVWAINVAEVYYGFGMLPKTVLDSISRRPSISVLDNGVTRCRRRLLTIGSYSIWCAGWRSWWKTGPWRGLRCSSSRTTRPPSPSTTVAIRRGRSFTS